MQNNRIEHYAVSAGAAPASLMRGGLPKNMNTTDKVIMLRSLRERLRSNEFRSSIVTRRDILGELSGLLNHDPTVQTNVTNAADILSQPGFSNALCERMLGRIDFLVGQAITELETNFQDAPPRGTKIFIGHGRSSIWKDLKEFLQERLGLEWDEFNRVPVAGVTNVVRLSDMLDQACFAFLVMTGEDEQPDGKVHARLNVIHEAGLFQGKLGFSRAIVLIEEGCEEFSNIQGLGQIRFPKSNIGACFEDVRKVLEREKLITEG